MAARGGQGTSSRPEPHFSNAASPKEGRGSPAKVLVSLLYQAKGRLTGTDSYNAWQGKRRNHTGSGWGTIRKVYAFCIAL